MNKMKVLVLGLHKEGIEAVKALKVLKKEVLAFDDGIHPLWKQRAQEELKSLSKNIFHKIEPVWKGEKIEFVILEGPRDIYQSILSRDELKEVPVFTPLQFLIQNISIPYVAITGTNGKSTVSKMVETLLTQGGKKVFLGGGAFEPFSACITRGKKFDIAVLETGSGVLNSLTFFKPTVAVITNLVPSHFERFETREQYFAAKGKVFLSQEKEDYLIYDAENSYSVDLVKKASSHLFPIYHTDPKKYSHEIQESAFYDKKELIFCKSKDEKEIYFIEKMPFQGPMQRINALLTIATCRLLGIGRENCQQGLDAFKSLPHRMHRCFEKNGLIFYDDTSASNPAATAWGITSFQKPIVLIMGGINWGANYAKLYRYMQKKVKLLILIGDARRKMYQHLKEAVKETYLVSTLDEAVPLAIEKSSKGDSIVFSPAAPPEPHLYASDEDRGNSFKKLVCEHYGVELELKRKSQTLNPQGTRI